MHHQICLSFLPSCNLYDMLYLPYLIISVFESSQYVNKTFLLLLCCLKPQMSHLVKQRKNQKVLIYHVYVHNCMQHQCVYLVHLEYRLPLSSSNFIPFLYSPRLLILPSTRRIRADNFSEYSDMAVCNLCGWSVRAPLI